MTLHIVFQEADVAVLQAALRLDETFTGEVLQIKDDFAVGPLNHIYETEGMLERKNWWAEVIQYSPYSLAINSVNDQETVHAIRQFAAAVEENEIWIWQAPNVHDQCGYFWLICQLADILAQVRVVNLSNLPFINEKGSIFYPTELYEIRPSEFLKARQLRKQITPGAFEMLKEEWKKLCDTEDRVRIIENDKDIMGKSVTYFDKKILSALTQDEQKFPKFLQHLVSKMNIKTGDAFLAWRIRELQQEGLVDIKGNWEAGWKELLLRLPGGQPIETQVAQTD